MSGLIFGEKDGGGIAPVRVDEEGRLVTTSAGGGGTTSEVTGPAGEELATEATAADIATSAQALAGAVDGNAIRTVDGSPTFTAAPPGATQAPAVRVVGDGLDRFGEPILRVKAEDGQIVTAVQGDGSGDPQDTAPWLMKTVKDVGGGTMADKTIATEETAEAVLAEVADDATTVDVQAVRDRLPAMLDGGRLAVNATGTVQATGAGGAPLALDSSVDQLETKLGTLAAQEATTAKDASVDQLEALATAGNVNTASAAASLAAIDAGTVAALGKQAITGSESVTQATGDTWAVDTELSATGSLATEAKQDAGNASLASIDAGIPATLGAAGGMRVEGVVGGQAVPISAASLPLPAGAAANASVDEVETKLGTLAAQEATLSALSAKVPALGPALFTGAQPVVLARPSRNADGTTLAVAGTSHVISATPASLRRLEWRYTGAGTKYLVICNQAGGTANAANWTRWYRPMTNGAGLLFFEWPEGLFCSLGIVLGVSATEPTTTLTVSANAAENFVPVNWSFQ